MLSCLCKECNQTSTRIKAGAGEAFVAVEMIGFAKKYLNVDGLPARLKQSVPPHGITEKYHT